MFKIIEKLLNFEKKAVEISGNVGCCTSMAVADLLLLLVFNYDYVNLSYICDKREDLLVDLGSIFFFLFS